MIPIAIKPQNTAGNHFWAKSIRLVAELNPLLLKKMAAGSILRFYSDRNQHFTQSFFSADAPTQALQFYIIRFKICL